MPMSKGFGNAPTLRSKNYHKKPRLAVTLGDPLGVGPEVVVKSIGPLSRVASLYVFGHREILEHAAQVSDISLPENVVVHEPELPAPEKRATGQECGRASLRYIKDAVQAILDEQCDAIVTGPICKEHIHAAGSPYPGHTELLAALGGRAQQTYLMMVGERLKVTLVTLHVALADVPRLITTKMVSEAIHLTHEAMRERFQRRRPRLAVAGLNPHAGEGGLFGDEDTRVIAPAIAAAAQQGIDVSGPHPGDTVFYRAVQGDFDAVISMYHDQGLIPVKLLHFDDAVNMTLGLPFVRTSVDHGVAFDIAWKNQANPASMIAAGKLAARIVNKENP